MSSAKERFFAVRKRAERGLSGRGGGKDGLRRLAELEKKLGARRLGKSLRRPRISIQVWLTALFLLVTALACVTAYSIVTGTIGEILANSAKQSFEQAVGNQFEDQALSSSRTPRLTEKRIANFAATRGVDWGIVRGDTGERLKGNLSGFDPGTVQRALQRRDSETGLTAVDRGGANQTLATYASPIQVRGAENTALVFSRVYTESDLNVSTALQRVNRLALLAGTLALLIAGFSGYVVANLISRRLNRLDGAARRLAAGNFDERITTRVEDEVGSLGATFNVMASSLKGAFRQLQQEKTRSQAILDGMTDAVVGVDRDLNATFLNPRARELLENADPVFHERLREVLARSRFSGVPVTEPEIEASDSIIELRAAPLEDGALAILRDVTEERQIERAKAEFIANASHELKTPLFALSGHLEMLEDEEDEETREKFLEAMRGATERLQNLAKTLLDLSRLDANAVTFRLEEVDLEELLHELVRDFAYTGRDIRLSVEEGVPAVRTDPVQLYRMLAVLLDNALKYSGGSEGETPVDISLYRKDHHVLVSVRDRGCGIPQAEKPHVFERFYRAQGSSRADGTGLGLALAGEISQHLGGDISFESEVGQGSTFTLELPLPDGTGEPGRPQQRSKVP